MLEDKTATTGFDAHYVYLGAWAFRQIVTNRPERHVDIGAQIGWVTCLASVTKVVFLDVRPFPGSVEGLQSRAGDILALPFGDLELSSVSCLHVAEHIGLGRYGDAIDPLGTRKAIEELTRVLAVGGRLYFALPVGRPKVVFNAHRIHDPTTILQWFGEGGLRVEEFAAVDDGGRFCPHAEPRDFRDQRYACGMYLVRR
jgi:SAM-dependent methyltransferase